MWQFGIKLIPEELRSFDSASVDGTLQLVGSTFTHPIVLLKVINNSSQLITVSYDGTTNHDVCPAGSFFLYDVSANKRRSDGLQFGVGDGVYITGTAGVGTIYVVTFYTGPA